jgi:poly(3-hydroxybutyrate) depolymerase
MKAQRVLLLIVVASAIYAQCLAQTTIGRQKVDQFTTTAWGTQTYGLTWLPDDYNTTTTKYPLVIFFHGSGEGGDGISGLNNLIRQGLPYLIAQGMNPEADNPVDGKHYKFIVISPQAPSSWRWSYSWQYLQYMLPEMISRYRVDVSRIYVTGLSAGGAGTWSCVTNGPDAAKNFAAIVPVSAAGTNTPTEAAQLPLVGGTYGVKVWSTCGANDSFNSWMINATNTINTASPAPLVPAVATSIPGAGHDPSAWNTSYMLTWRNNSQNLNVFEWMLKWQRATNTPSADAGSNKTITLPTNQVTLNGSGTATAGNSITSYAWSKISGPSSFTIASPSSASTNITNLTQGTYVFRLTVTDNNGATATADVTVTVNPVPNALPTVNAGSDLTITLPMNSVTLTGTGNDTDGTISSYSWGKISGPSQYSIASPSTAQTVVNNLAQGVYQFQLTVTDNSGGSASDIVIVTVNPAPNIAPTANAGADVAITLPVNSLTLNGSGSDADGTIASYQWTKVAGPATYTIVSPGQAQTVINNLAQGVYQFQLLVTDNAGATAKDTVVVTVNAAPNVPPVANAGSDQTITLPVNSTSLNGSGTDTDGTIVSYSWTKIAGPSSFSILSANQAQTAINNLVQGVYQFELTVTDNAGAKGKDTVVVTVNPALNIPPVANAGADQVITLPVNTVSLNGSGTDTDGNIVSYLWTKISGPASFVIVSPNQGQTNINNLIQGVYQFVLKVTDNSGATAEDTVAVTVNAAPNVVPSVNAGSDISITLPLDSAVLNGSATDADGSISSYQWTKISGPTQYSIVSPFQAQTAVKNLVQGTYQFELNANDNNGATGKDTIVVVVNAAIPPPPPPNSLPISNAGTDQTITLPLDSVQLNGSGTDTDGTIASYQWIQITGPQQYQIKSPSQSQTIVSGLKQGIYQFELIVTDNNGGIGKDTVIITVNPKGNVAPTANAGADAIITLPVDSIQLNGSGVDADGTIVGYSWKEISGPPACNIVNSLQPVTLARNLITGSYQFEFSVTDDNGAIAKDTIQVTVNPHINTPPMVNAGKDTVLTLPANSVVLTANATDRDGTIASYSWNKISGPMQYNIVSPTQSQTAINNLTQGTYQFEVTATDNDGAVGKDTVDVIVNAAVTVSCNGIKRYMVPGGDGGRYMNGDPSNTTWYKPVNPGDTLVLSAKHSWSYFSIEGYSGTADCPIVIQNEGGQVWLTAGIGLTSCKYVKVTGDGDPNTYYGFRVYNPAQDVNGIGVSIVGKSRVIEVERIDVYKKTYGVWAKQDPQCDESFNYPNYIMDSIEIHHSRFKNIGQDCIYAGNTDPLGKREYLCNGVIKHFIPMRLSNINIHHLIIDSCNRTGIQLGGANSGYNQIHDNVVTRCGYEYNQYQGTGISIGGMTRNCHVYNNVIKNTFLYGIMSFGVGTNYIENNVIDSTGWLDGAPNTVSRPSNILASPKETIPFDSTRIIIRNNKLGLNATTDDTNIGIVVWGPPTWATGNVLCSNTKLDGATAAKVYVDPTVNVINDCSKGLPNIPPSAFAGNDIIVNPIGDTVLHGTASDADGTIISYNWTKVSGPGQFSINTPDSSATIISNLVPGVYVFRLTVMDNDSLTAIDDIQVSVAPPNTAPVANAGANQTITLPLNTVTLAGSGSDIDGTISSYQWTKISGPASFVIVNANNPLTQINSLVQGTYQFELLVTDNNGAQDRDTVSIKVNAAPPPTNVPPVANAGSDITITLPTNFVALNGSGNDPDGSIASYQWTKISGPANHLFNNAAQAQTTVGNLDAGVYQFELKVIDNVGAIAKDTITVTVNVMPNLAPLVNAGADQTITLPLNTTILNGAGMDADGSIVNFTWTKISGPSQYSIVSSNQTQTVINNLVQGVYQFELMAIDNNGAIGRDTVVVTVNAVANTLPVANAGVDQTITLPVNSVSLIGSGNDPDGSIVSYQWAKISGPASFVIASATQAQTTVSNLVEGVYQFELTVTDNSGAIAKDILQITVNPIPNTPPVANAGADQVITLPINDALVSGNGIDVDGTIVSYQWTKISGPEAYAIGNTGSAQTYLHNLVQGVYQFELTVTDNLGAVGRDTITITVNAANNLSPVANAGNNQSITLPTNSVVLSGSGTDADGTVIAYSWTKISGPSQFVIASAAQAQTVVNSLVEGTYQFELKVTDNHGVVGRDTVTIVVNPAVATVSTASLYPNPASSIINIQISAVTHRNQTTIKIYEMSGVLVYKEEYLRTQPVELRTIDVTKLPPGTYMVIVGADINNEIALKFIKQ